jgi:hypothetical protein
VEGHEEFCANHTATNKIFLELEALREQGRALDEMNQAFYGITAWLDAPEELLIPHENRGDPQQEREYLNDSFVPFFNEDETIRSAVSVPATDHEDHDRSVPLFQTLTNPVEVPTLGDTNDPDVLR